MSTQWNGGQLLEPVAPEAPCGRNLEDTDTLAAFDAYQIFGQTTLEPTPREPGEQARKEPRKSDRPPNWEEIEALSLEALQQSKDLRLLAHLGTATLRTDGVLKFAETLKVAAGWLDRYWNEVYPLLEEDGIFRRNALNCFADPVAVIDGLRRTPLVSSRQHGRVSLRDVEVASGTLTPGEGESAPDTAQIGAVFAATPIESLRELTATAAGALESLTAIDERMRGEVGVEAAPSFEPLVQQLKRMQGVLRTQLASHPAGGDAEADEGAVGDESTSGGSGVAVGAIRSRQDAIRALDAVSEFFRRNEPSSPVPLFLDRAKRLVSKDFLEVLADVAPEALAQARAAGGIRQD